MSGLEDYTGAIDELVPGTHPTGEAEQLNAILAALEVHSKYRPRRIVEDIPGNGGFDYPLADLALWENDFSVVAGIEYPVDDSNPTVNRLGEDDWTIYSKPAGDVLRFLGIKPGAAETIRITYTGRHSIDDDACTIAAADEKPVQKLAASLYCRILAAAYAQDQDSTIQADSVDHSSKRREYEAQAMKYRREYDEHMGFSKSGGPKPACVTQDWDTGYPHGRDWLTHPRRWR